MAKQFIKISHDMPNHPKISVLSNAAYRLLIELISYSALYVLDGKIPEIVGQQIATKIAKQNASKLLGGCEGDALPGLDLNPDLYLKELQMNHPLNPSIKVQNGFIYIHDYLEYQTSREYQTIISQRRREAAKVGAKCKQSATTTSKQKRSKKETELRIKNKKLITPYSPPEGDIEPSVEPGSKKVQSYSSEFETFWEIYPRRQGKRKAAEAFKRALKRANLELILEGANRYLNDPNRVDEYTAHASTWLNRDGWEDQPEPARNQGRGMSQVEIMRQNLADAFMETGSAPLRFLSGGETDAR